MADIFISYARENRDVITPMAQLLVNKGWSVWWDPDMVPGWHFADVIQQEITTANCIIVAWTKESVKSEWVWNEAQEGKKRKALLPVLFESVEPPLGFRHMHAARLIDWNGQEDHEDVQQLLKVVEVFCGHPSERKSEAPEASLTDSFDSTPIHKNDHPRNVPKLTLPDKPSIAVLPFDNMSADPEQEYFSDGITEDIITDLSKISGLFVISRHSTFVYKGKSATAREVSHELGVRYIVEGSVRKAGERLRINAQLIDALKDDHLWAERFDRQLDDIFEIQDEVSRKIVSALEIKLTGMEEERLGHTSTDNIEAYDLLLRGQEQFYLSTPDGIKNAIDLYSKSIELDPNNAEAYAWKSRVVVFLFISGFKSTIDDTIIPALVLARKAVALDELLPIAHAALGWVLCWNREIDDAIVEAKKAIDLDPNFADGYMWQSMILASSGDGQKALESIKKGIRLNPMYSVSYILAFSIAYFTLGKYEEALSYLDRAIKRNPNFIPNHIFKTGALGLLGRKEEAHSSADKLVKLNPSYNGYVSNIYNDKQMAETLNKGLNNAGLETQIIDFKH